MLTTVEAVQRLPSMLNAAAIPVSWLNDLVGAADAAIKRYVKRNIEQTAYVEFYSGNEMPDVICQEFPVLGATTTIALVSDGLSLPQSTINVASTAGFDLGTGGDPGKTPPTLGIQTGVSTQTTVTYTGITATSFTGCVGGTGILKAGNQVYMPVVFLDNGGQWGQVNSSQPLGAFSAGTQLQYGSQYALVIDKGGKRSNRGLIRKLGGPGPGWTGFYLQNFYSGKLSSWRKPCWPRGDGNIKVCYSAGYNWKEIPFDLVYACNMLVAQMVRIQPNGANMSSESLGTYSYSVLADGDNPEMGTLRGILKSHREIPIG